ncbi:MAG TPA: hypothetical protein VGI06_01660 [Acidimicrobiales bacterium]
MSSGPHASVGRRIFEAAVPAHGVLSRAALTALGVSKRAITARLRTWELTRCDVFGLFVVPAARDEFTTLAIALARSKLLVASHRLAAAVYGWDGFDRPDDRLLRDPPLVCPWTSRRELRPYRRHDLSPGELRRVNGLRVPSAAWTLSILEEASHVSADRLEQAVESALRRRHVGEDELWPRARPMLAGVLAARGRGAAPTGSLLETLTVQRVLRPFGVVEVARQVEVFGDGVRLGRPDFLLDGWTFLEVDGGQHDEAAHRASDRARDLRIEALGPAVVRVGPQEIAEPGVLARRLLTIIERGRRAHSGAPPPLEGNRLELSLRSTA